MIFKNKLDMNTKFLAKYLGVSHLLLKAILWENEYDFRKCFGFDFESIPTINEQCKADTMYLLDEEQILYLVCILKKYMISQFLSIRFIKRCKKIIKELTVKGKHSRPVKVMARKKNKIVNWD